MSFTRLLLVSALLSATASAAVSLSFTKSGTDLIITINTPVTYVSTVDAGNLNKVVFQGISTTFNGGSPSESTATLTTNFYVAALPIVFDNTWGSGLPLSETVTPADTFISSASLHTVAVGTLVTLSTGTITLHEYEGPAPADGIYETYLMRGFDIASQAGVIPEPSALGIVAGLGVLPLLRRRRCH